MRAEHGFGGCLRSVRRKSFGAMAMRLGWRHKVKFDELVREMVEADLAELRRDGSHRNMHD